MERFLPAEVLGYWRQRRANLSPLGPEARQCLSQVKWGDYGNLRGLTSTLEQILTTGRRADQVVARLSSVKEAMRPGFATFRIEPETHRQFLFGARERKQRNDLLGEIEGFSYGGEGFKAVIFGDYGRGKTHMCHNLEFEIKRSSMRIIPVYIKCSSFTSKAPFQTLFHEMITGLGTSEVKRIASSYAKLVSEGNAQSLRCQGALQEIGHRGLRRKLLHRPA
jgi:hypothetical protein